MKKFIFVILVFISATANAFEKEKDKAGKWGWADLGPNYMIMWEIKKKTNLDELPRLFEERATSLCKEKVLSMLYGGLVSTDSQFIAPAGNNIYVPVNRVKVQAAGGVRCCENEAHSKAEEQHGSLK